MSAREIAFSPDPTEEELLRYWTLSKSDKAQVRSCRGEAQRYAFAIQLCVLRQRGHFMSPEQTRVPLRIVNHLGGQLGFQPTLFLPPIHRLATLKEQRKRIRVYLDFRPFDQSERTVLEEWLRTHDRYDLRRSQLANMAHEFLLQRRTMIPSKSRLNRIVNSEIARHEKISFRRLASELDVDLRRRVDQLLDIDEVSQISTLEWLTQYPPEGSPVTLLEYMERIEHVVDTGIDRADLREIRPTMINYCSRLAELMSAYKLRRLPDDKRLALLFSLLFTTRQSLLDNVVEMHRTFLIGMNRRARRAAQKRERQWQLEGRKGL